MTIALRRFLYYGRIGYLPRHAEEMHDLIDAHVTIARKLRNVPDRHTTLVEELGELLLAQIIAHGCKLPHDEILDLLSLDVGLNVQGLKHWLNYTRIIDQSKI